MTIEEQVAYYERLMEEEEKSSPDTSLVDRMRTYQMWINLQMEMEFQKQKQLKTSE